MRIRHYVLLATDGFINLPAGPIFCASGRIDTRPIYIFGFTGGLFKVTDPATDYVEYYDQSLDPTVAANWPVFLQKKGTAIIPSPMIWGDQDDKIYITLINLGMKFRPDLMDFHTIHMHGAHVATQLDGFPESSFGVPMWMNTSAAPPMATYLFRPEHPGTYMYHCHIEASEHVQMGMYGALIIYPSKESLAESGITQDAPGGLWRLNGILQPQIPVTATHRNFAYNDISTFFDKEYVMLLSDIDSIWHHAVETGSFYPAYRFKADYWLINGRAFPDTLNRHPLTPPPSADPNLRQINYESYVHIKTNDKFLLRMINLGYRAVPWHIHGWHFDIIGKDAHISPFISIAASLGMSGIHEFMNMGFTLNIASGETFDLLLTADDKRGLYRDYLVNGDATAGFGNPPFVPFVPLDSLCDQMAALQAIDPEAIFDIPYSPDPGEPVACPPETITSLDICAQPPGDQNDNFFPQFYPMHNHDDYAVTNKGLYPGGQLTIIQTDAPEDA
ncbi:MAG: multicopper oxidase domain-containing protein [Syntrophomonadaceae bacterium]|nr:multicopper oxidase domain-containing protein [Syntrophomonadaceae bacterium]